ncbi:MAG: hypothetical protein ACRCV9_19425 [Burkholderiaceae bacterium]
MPPVTLDFESTHDLAQSCERLFRPIARLALENGLPTEELEAVMRQVILQETKAAQQLSKRHARMQRFYAGLQ